jgi:hypothetical protein
MDKLVLLFLAIIGLIFVPGLVAADDLAENSSCDEAQYSEIEIQNETHVLCADKVKIFNGGTSGRVNHYISQQNQSILFVTVPFDQPDSYRFYGYSEPTTLHSYNLVENEYNWNTTVNSYIVDRHTNPESDVIFAATADGEVYSINKQTGKIRAKQRAAPKVRDVRPGGDSNGYDVSSYSSGSHIFVQFWLRGDAKTALIDKNGEVILEDQHKNTHINQVGKKVVVSDYNSTYGISLDSGELQWEKSGLSMNNALWKETTYLGDANSHYGIFEKANEWVFVDISSGNTHSAPKPSDQNMQRRYDAITMGDTLVVQYGEIKETRETYFLENGGFGGSIVPIPWPRKASLEAYSISDGDQLFSRTDVVEDGVGDENIKSKSDVYDLSFLNSKGDFAYYDPKDSENEIAVLNIKEGETSRVDAQDLIGFHNTNPVFKGEDKIWSLNPSSKEMIWQESVDWDTLGKTDTLPYDGEEDTNYNFLPLYTSESQVDYYVYTEEKQIRLIDMSNGGRDRVSFEKEIGQIHTYTEKNKHYVIPRNSSKMVTISDKRIERASVTELPQETIWTKGAGRGPALVSKNFTFSGSRERYGNFFDYDIYIRNHGRSTLTVADNSIYDQANDDVYILESNVSTGPQGENVIKSDLLRLELIKKSELATRVASQNDNNETATTSSKNTNKTATNRTTTNETTDSSNQTPVIVSENEDNTADNVPGFSIVQMIAAFGAIGYLYIRRFSDNN